MACYGRIVGLLAITVALAAYGIASESGLEEEWRQFKTQFGKKYENAEEDARRLELYRAEMERIREHNERFELGQVSFEMGANRFTDMTEEERRAVLGLKVGDNNCPRFRSEEQQKRDLQLTEDLPDEVDWRDVNGVSYVTGVKDQGMCGSCWAFSANGALESQFKIALGGELTRLSEQHLVDCSILDGNYGCNGGLMHSAYEYIINNGGVPKEEYYPYRGFQLWNPWCFDKFHFGAKVTNYTFLDEGSDAALRHAVARVGPIGVAFHVTDAFQGYKGGVFTDDTCNEHELNHGVLVVGYGTDPTHGDYWTVKNSWGSGWGEDGYIRVSRNTTNTCGISCYAVYPGVQRV